MSLTLDVHIIQSFPFSNLNRDDTGSPKNCVFGGSERARVSSQCIKRALRLHPAFSARIAAAHGDVGKRSKRLKAELMRELSDLGVKDGEALASAAIRELGFEFESKKPDLTEYLLYLGTREISELAREIAKPVVREVLVDTPSAEADKEKAKKPPKGQKSKDGVVTRALKDIIGSARLEREGYAADIALFGRMMADDKDMNVSASCQVAHGVSTHTVETTFDYFTAVDDFNTQDSGAGMLGIQEFNSACYYRYANVSVDQLTQNLGGDKDIAIAAVLGFAEASVKAIPTGKQNSTAAMTPPAYGRLLLRTDGAPWSLAGAFSAAIRTDRSEESIEQRSIARLEQHLQSLYRVYGKDGVVLDQAFDIHREDSPSLSDLLAGLEAELRRRMEGAA